MKHIKEEARPCHHDSTDYHDCDGCWCLNNCGLADMSFLEKYEDTQK